MTLSISENLTKIAACATKVTTLFEPKTEGTKEPVPEIWFDGVDPGATKRWLAGAILMWDSANGVKFGHVPSSSAFMTNSDGHKVRVVMDGSDKGSWLGKADVMSAKVWPAVFGEERVEDGRVKKPSVGGHEVVVKPVEDRTGLKEVAWSAGGTIYGQSSIGRLAALSGYPTEDWVPMAGSPGVAGSLRLKGLEGAWLAAAGRPVEIERVALLDAVPVALLIGIRWRSSRCSPTRVESRTGGAQLGNFPSRGVKTFPRRENFPSRGGENLPSA